MRIFISATSKDLHEERRQVADLVRRHGGQPVMHECVNRGMCSIEARRVLEEKLRDCDGVIHLCGFHFGAYPCDYEPGEPRRSCTQMEFHLADQMGKDILVAVAHEATYLPRCPAQTRHKAALQREHYEALTSGERPYHAFRNAADLQDAIASFMKEVAEPASACVA